MKTLRLSQSRLYYLFEFILLSIFLAAIFFSFSDVELPLFQIFLGSLAYIGVAIFLGYLNYFQWDDSEIRIPKGPFSSHLVDWKKVKDCTYFSPNSKYPVGGFHLKYMYQSDDADKESETIRTITCDYGGIPVKNLAQMIEDQRKKTS